MEKQLWSKLLILLLAVMGSVSQNQVFGQVDTKDYFNLSLEELMNLEVTVASKKSENIKGIPSSIYVISANDIERSGATSIMELLREVPGYWAVQNDYMNVDGYMRNAYEGSVLVLLDGTPMLDLMYSDFSFDNFEIPLSQIERIEIIKGSGGTVYGANSASGVISITTKNADALPPLYVQGKIGGPLYAEGSFGGGSQLGDKFSLSYYGNYKHFGGFDQFIDDDPNSRFTEDDNSTDTYSAGFNFNFQTIEKLTLSGALHMSGYSSGNYFSIYPTENAFLYGSDMNNPRPEVVDSVFFKTKKNSHITSNLKAEYSFSETHNIFARISSDAQNLNHSVGGGLKTQNSILDFEIQDNFKVAFNNFSVGGNLRFLNYNIEDINYAESINYIDKKNSETLTAFFIQDKITFGEDKFSFYLGVKAENFSLINSKYYLSPMAKMVYMPNDKVTLWGGYSKAFTTPGYNQTNIELSMYKANSPDVFYDFAYPFAYQGTYDYLIGEGYTPEQAEGYLATPEGEAMVDMQTQAAIAGEAENYPGHFAYSAISAPKTEPAEFSNIEFGLRLQPLKNLYFESNFFYTEIKNGVINSPRGFDRIASPTYEGEYIEPYYYGNYMTGTNWGIESIVKFQPTESVMLEVSHSLFKDELEYQANDDFPIESLSNKRIDNGEYPTIPENVFRAKAYVDLPKEFKLTLSGLFASKYYNRFAGIDASYQPELERFEPLFGSEPTKTSPGKNDSRTIFNVRVDKSLLNRKINLFVYANDLFSSPFVESVNQLQTVYPRQVGQMIGAGITYSLK
ncbi:hypothetical protein E9993_01885 [Labilibacter sediminis]|nr:hypothetical protein E9993_01885 [Labilibacter sediminis]